jgi:Methyltransferase domain
MIRFEQLNPIVRTKPEYLQVSRWTGHIPFGMLLIDLMRPRSFVELGTHYGVSYMAFCQAVKTLNTGTRCYAIDTWTGDPQSGSYSGDVLGTLQTHHDPAYGDFSTLMQMSFDEAAPRFDDQSIDLLHIDGCHIYEAVRHDFETWTPKLSERSIVLFHDTAEYNDEQEFGVWRLWGELSRQYPSFNFTHEHGLGVLAVGKNYANSLDAFFRATPEEQSLIRGQFCELAFALKNEELMLREAGLGHHIELLQRQVAELEQFGAEMRHLKEQLQESASSANDKLSHAISERNLLYSHLAAVERRKAKLEADLQSINADRLWRLVKRIRRHKPA